MEAAAPLDRPSPEPGSGGSVAIPFLRKGRGWGGAFLLTGVVALGATDLVFALWPGWMFWLTVGGVLLVGFGWLMLAVRGWRGALAATVAVVASYFALLAVAPASRALSWEIRVRAGQDEMDRAVQLLEPVRMTQELYRRRPHPPCTRLPGLPFGDCAKLQAAMSGFGAHDAWKEGAVTVFETYSSFNARGGLLHCPGGDCGDAPGQGYPRYVKHVTGDWYRWAQ